MRIPILRIPFSAQDRAFLHQAWDDILSSGILTAGRWTEEFQSLFRAFTGARYAVATSSGTSALELIIRGLDICEQSIIVPTNTFFATALAVVHAGNRVIFADADPATMCLDPEDVRRRIRPDTQAVILVHIGGIITPAVDALQKVCHDEGLYLIEDCAHAHGSRIDGRQAGTLGIAGAFSFFPTKVLVTGEGGMVTTNEEQLYEKLVMLRNHGKNPQRGHAISELGYNWRLSEITAAIGVQQMRKAGDLIADRQRIARFYDTALAEIEGICPLKLAPHVTSSYYKYIAYLDERYDRSVVKRVMKETYHVSLTGEVYATLCHQEPLWEKVFYYGRRRAHGAVRCMQWPVSGCDEKDQDFPGAEYLSRHHICLPVYPGLSEDELRYTVESLARTLNQYHYAQREGNI